MRKHWRAKLFAMGAIVLAVALVAVPARHVLALIMGGEGNKPINDPGWPKGAAEIFNHPGRVAWWEGRRLAADNGRLSAAAIPRRSMQFSHPSPALT